MIYIDSTILTLFIDSFFDADSNSEVRFCRAALVFKLFDFEFPINFLYGKIVSRIRGTRSATTSFRGSRIRGI